MDVLTLSNPVFSSFAFCSAVLVLKMFFISLLTSKTRGDNQAFATPEDAQLFGKGKVRKEKVTTWDDPKVERVRRNHLNDLENIPSFVFMALIYMFCHPAPMTAIWHFRVFTVSRICHMLSYQLAIPQPSRALSYMVGMIVTISMAIQILMVTVF